MRFAKRSLPRLVLITGATGTIGSELVDELLRGSEDRLALVIRPKRGKSPQERLRGLLSDLGYSEEERERLARGGRITILPYELTELPTVLAQPEYFSLAQSITSIVHCACEIKLNLSEGAAQRAILEPTEAMLKCVHQLLRHGHGTLRSLDLVSTVGVAGRDTTSLAEEPISLPRSFRNSYESMKARCEELTLSRLTTVLPLTIHRPSMVVGQSRTGRVRTYQVFYYLCELFSGKFTRGLLPEWGEFQLDLIPVDYVAQAIAWSVHNPPGELRFMHLCSGPSGTLGLQELITTIQKFRYFQSREDLSLLPLALHRELLPHLSHRVAESNWNPLPVAPFFLDYLGTPQVFQNSRTRELLEVSGPALPTVHDFLECILGSYVCAREAYA